MQVHCKKRRAYRIKLCLGYSLNPRDIGHNGANSYLGALCGSISLNRRPQCPVYVSFVARLELKVRGLFYLCFRTVFESCVPNMWPIRVRTCQSACRKSRHKD